MRLLMSTHAARISVDFTPMMVKYRFLNHAEQISDHLSYLKFNYESFSLHNGFYSSDGWKDMERAYPREQHGNPKSLPLTCEVRGGALTSQVANLFLYQKMRHVWKYMQKQFSDICLFFFV